MATGERLVLVAFKFESICVSSIGRFASGGRHRSDPFIECERIIMLRSHSNGPAGGATTNIKSPESCTFATAAVGHPSCNWERA
jgi:hypothetical protein